MKNKTEKALADKELNKVAGGTAFNPKINGYRPSDMRAASENGGLATEVHAGVEKIGFIPQGPY